MSQTGERSDTPRAMIHQRILDVAKSNPGATLEEIADEIAGASIGLVERVLEEYGDPAEDQQGHDTKVTPESQSPPGTLDGEVPDTEDYAQQDEVMEQENENSVTRAEPSVMENTSDRDLELESPPENANREEEEDDLGSQSSVDAADLTEKQLKTLRLIAERPDATQGALAERLDVTRATVSRWLSDIPEFEWTQRQEFITKMLDDDENAERVTADESVDLNDHLPEAEQAAPNGVGQSEAERINERLNAIEGRLETIWTGSEPQTESECLVVGPELAHKVVYASINSDLLTEKEELQLLKDLRG